MVENEGEPRDGEETPLELIVTGAVTGLILLVAFGLMAAGFGFFWVVFVVGFAGVLPMALGLVRLYQRRQKEDESAGDETEDALEALRQRYARGEISETEFEHRVERLLETESVADARKYAERTRSGSTVEQREYENDHEYETESS